MKPIDESEEHFQILAKLFKNRDSIPASTLNHLEKKALEAFGFVGGTSHSFSFLKHEAYVKLTMTGRALLKSYLIKSNTETAQRRDSELAEALWLAARMFFYTDKINLDELTEVERQALNDFRDIGGTVDGYDFLKSSGSVAISEGGKKILSTFILSARFMPKHFAVN